ncbi:hypothetical protein PXQ59_002177 [Vibrio parahaemolyticus]|nr:hypothetical protein [Vibrio parahaemolyticus]
MSEEIKRFLKRMERYESVSCKDSTRKTLKEWLNNDKVYFRRDFDNQYYVQDFYNILGEDEKADECGVDVDALVDRFFDSPEKLDLIVQDDRLLSFFLNGNELQHLNDDSYLKITFQNKDWFDEKLLEEIKNNRYALLIEENVLMVERNNIVLHIEECIPDVVDEADHIVFIRALTEGLGEPDTTALKLDDKTFKNRKKAMRR